ncbi:IS3 family transposase [Cetobacterium sp.]|uniref:IS3 family transposase n=1 Tax=Cetobacterium sp. TaxID=2071632 RepID=UPI003EE78354
MYRQWSYGEIFFGYKILKVLLKKYKNLSELENDIRDYIKFYNRERLQKNLNSLSPLKYGEQNSMDMKNNVDN